MDITDTDSMRRFLNVDKGGLDFSFMIGHLQEMMNKKGKGTDVREDYGITIIDEVFLYCWLDHLSRAYNKKIHSKGLDAFPLNFPSLEDVAN